VILALYSLSAHASHFTGKIEKLVIGRLGHQVFVHMKNAPATCGLDHPLGFNYAFSLESHSAGKEILSVLLAAKVADKQIGVQGTGACTISADMEDISYIYLY